jgi:hypothetical protein
MILHCHLLCLVQVSHITCVNLLASLELCFKAAALQLHTLMLGIGLHLRIGQTLLPSQVAILKL